jgi:hypothetical protein
VKQRLIKRAGGQMVLVVRPMWANSSFTAQPGTALPPELDFLQSHAPPRTLRPRAPAPTPRTRIPKARRFTPGSSCKGCWNSCGRTPAQRGPMTFPVCPHTPSPPSYNHPARIPDGTPM